MSNVNPVNPNGSNKHSFECIGCKSRLSFTMPKRSVVNTPTYSAVVATHEKLNKCGKCGQSYVFIIQANQLRWNVIGVSEEQRREIEGSELISF